MKNFDEEIYEENQKDAHEKLLKAVDFIYAENQNINEFLKLCKKSALQENSKAQYILGMWYEYRYEGISNYFEVDIDGDQWEDLEVDYEKAIHWYEKSANNGDPVAKYSLAWLYLYKAEELKNQKDGFLWLKRAANDNYRLAQTLLSKIYYDERYAIDCVDKDIDRAIYWMEKSYESGDPSATYDLGFIYLEKDESEECTEKAINWFKKGAEKGNINCKEYLGYAYSNEERIGIDIKKSIEYYENAVESGSVFAKHKLVFIYLYTPELEYRNYEKGFRYIQELADENIGEAQYLLGKIYYESNYSVPEVEKDYQKAIYWLEKSFENGIVTAAADIGNIYSNEEYGVINYEKSLEWYKKGIENGDVTCITNLGSSYLLGLGVEIDFDTAIEWYDKAIEKGDVLAEHCKAETLEEEDYHGRDLEQAIYWHKSAASKGHIGSEYSLALIYLIKYEELRDEEEGLKWLNLAVEHEHVMAQFLLGKIYSNELYELESLEQDEEKAIYWMTKAFENGYISAAYDIGMLYLNDDTDDQLTEIAIEWLEKGAEFNDFGCEEVLGMIYSNKDSLYFDYKKAIYWYKKAIEHGSRLAKYNLARIYLYCEDENFDRERGMKLLYEMAEEDDTDAQYILGLIFYDYDYYVDGIEYDHKKAEYWLNRAFENGLWKAIACIGEIYFNKGDFKKAIEWYKIGIEKDDYASYRNLGKFYAHGIGVEKNYKKAKELLNKAIELGDEVAEINLLCIKDEPDYYEEDNTPSKRFESILKMAEQGKRESMNNLGMAYYRGEGVEIDDDKAFYWFLKSAEAGCKTAQNNVGACYISGDGCEKDPHKALEWFYKCAEGGYANGESSVAEVFYYGYVDGIVDYEKAMHWYKKAAESAIDCDCLDPIQESMRHIGHMYEHGQGVEVDYEQAMYWYNRAISIGCEKAQKKLDSLKRKMSGKSKEEGDEELYLRP